MNIDPPRAKRSCEVLIVEDDPVDMLLLDRALRSISESTGTAVAVRHCDNGLTGLSCVALSDLTARLPDVVVVDLNMPIMGGEVFLKRLRRDLALDTLQAVVLTTSEDEFIHEEASSTGANYVFVKPRSYAELLTIAAKIVEVATQDSRP